MQRSVRLVRKEDPPRAVICPALVLTHPLRLFFLSAAVPGLQLRARPGESMVSNVDGGALIKAPSCDRPSWGPWLQGLR